MYVSTTRQQRSDLLDGGDLSPTLPTSPVVARRLTRTSDSLRSPSVISRPWIILHGHLPWWNSFEGLGQPLVGEMQSAALFPLTLLFALPSGLFWFHISLEYIAGSLDVFLWPGDSLFPSSSPRSPGFSSP